jgi:hypothetical protein
VSQLGGYNGIPRDALAHLSAGNTFARYNIPRAPIDVGDVAIGATGVMLSTPIFLGAGETVTNLTFRSGATALATGTAHWFALYSPDSTPALIAQSADQGSAAWAANTTKTLALSTPQTVTRSGFYWAAVMVAASTVPTLVGSRYFPALVSGERNLGQTSGSGLSTTAPATIASPTAVQFVPVCVAT